MTVLLKDVDPSDLTSIEVEALRDICLGEGSNMTRWLEDTTPKAQDQVMLALEGEALIGWGLRHWYHNRKGKSLPLIDIFIRPDYRRKGIGSAIFKALSFGQDQPLNVGYPDQVAANFWACQSRRVGKELKLWP